MTLHQVIGLNAL